MERRLGGVSALLMRTALTLSLTLTLTLSLSLSLSHCHSPPSSKRVHQGQRLRTHEHDQAVEQCEVLGLRNRELDALSHKAKAVA